MDNSAHQTVHGTLQVALPAGWFAKESITLLGPDGQANVIASSEPLDPSMDSSRYTEIQGGLLRKEFRGYEESRFEPRHVFGLGGYLRESAWYPRDGVLVSQIQVYATIPGRGYTATATIPAFQAPRFRTQFQETIASLRIDHPARNKRRSTCTTR